MTRGGGVIATFFFSHQRIAQVLFLLEKGPYQNTKESLYPLVIDRVGSGPFSPPSLDPQMQ